MISTLIMIEPVTLNRDLIMQMHHLRDKEPELNTFVLVYDRTNNKTRIARIINIDGQKHWETDNRMLFSFDSFYTWMELPQW